MENKKKEIKKNLSLHNEEYKETDSDEEMGKFYNFIIKLYWGKGGIQIQIVWY